ncbi:pyridoxamine 5'-phosphate oxidase family protein [Anaerophaga thermohalophila]|uniref:pyridoxamine 5'-phosphate oxidase family protein n=1 Tax=Anaerophaga thermohalophila TaxID=177400 RepID=UPI0002F74641|nr:pyridoxamine 5'-phosphate oxidase family protein [Anaerophaga thermohalophila]
MRTYKHTDRQFIDAVISECKICFAGVIDENGLPYVIPMNFGYHKGVFFLHSAPEGRAIRSLEKNNHICLTFSSGEELAWQNADVACSYQMKAKSVVAEGRVTFIEDMELKRQALDYIMAQYSDKSFNYGDPAVKNVKIWRVDVDNIGCKEFGARHDAYKK